MPLFQKIQKGINFCFQSEIMRLQQTPLGFDTTWVKTVADAVFSYYIIPLFQNYQNLPKMCAAVKLSSSRNAYIL